MVQLDAISMDMLRVSSQKVVDTLAHSQSSTAMSKSCSGISLASSHATQRTKCSSGFSSIGGSSTRGGANSSAPHTPGQLDRSSLTDAEENDSSSSTASNSDEQQSGQEDAGDSHNPFPAAPPRTARGGGKTVLGGVAPTMQGMLRRRARFSGWRTESSYFEVRSTALVSFVLGAKGGSSGSNGGSGSGTGGVTLASIAQRIIHPTAYQKPAAQAGEWHWSADIAGAERVSELPALSKKGVFAFGVEYGAGKRKTLVLAAASAAERRKWISALDGARHSVKQKDFKPISVIGEGHFGKVLLVRWDRRKASDETEAAAGRTASASSLSARSLRGSLARSSSLSSFPARVAEEGTESDDHTQESMLGKASNARNHGRAKSQRIVRSSAGNAAGTSGDGARGVKFLAVKEVALHKGTSLPGVLNERQILGCLKEHPFVVTLQCAWRSGNFLYYGLDFLPGADLFELFRRQYIKMDITSARVYGGQVALALQHLHAHGICYRDLKPENILVDANGHLRLADMGLSKILGVGEDAVRTTTVCGTRAYLAPEMVLRKPYGFSVDYWQFGCFLFELYAGHSPFWTPRSGPPGRSTDQTVALILAGEISYPRSMEPVAKSFIRDLLHPDAGLRLGCRPRSSGAGNIAVSKNDVDSTPTATKPNTSSSSVSLADGKENRPSSASLVGSDSSTAGSSASKDGSNKKKGSREVTSSGWNEVREHPFFSGMDWEALLRRETPAPLKPGAFGKGMVGNFAREYTRQRVQWGSEQQELRGVADKECLFKRELLGFDFVRHP